MTNVESVRGKRKASAPWFKCFPQDWREATRTLTPEQRGIYFDCLCILYESEKPIPKDEKWVAHHIHVSTRLWRSVRDALIAAGKLVETDDGYTNARAEKVIAERSNQVRTSLGSKPVQPRFALGSASVRARSSREISENENKNNEASRETSAYVYARSDFRVQNTENRTHQPASVEQDADGLAGLNGAASMMIRDIEAWMVGGNEACARNWLTSTTKIFGQEITKTAYQRLGTEMATGVVFAKPLQAWSSIARRMVEESKARASPGWQQPMTKREQKIQRDRECLEFIKKMPAVGAPS